MKLREKLTLDGAYTLEAWIKPAEVDRDRIILGELEDVFIPYHIFGSPAANHAWDRTSVSIRGGRVNFRDQGMGTARSDADVQPGTWHHVVATYKPGVGMSLFVDGKLSGFAVASRERAASAALPFVSVVGATGGISSRYGDTIADCRGFFAGLIDEVRVYEGAMSPAEIAKRYEAAGVNE